MSEQTELDIQEAPAPTPWRALGFDSFEAYQKHQEDQISSLTTQHQEAQKLIGRQGDQLGNVRKALEKLGVKIDEAGKISDDEVKRHQQPPPPPMNYAEENRAIESRLSPEDKQRLEEHFSSISADQLAAMGITSKKELATKPELRYHYLQSFMEEVGELEPDSFFGGESNSQSAAPSLAERVRGLFASEEQRRLQGVMPVTAGRQVGQRDRKPARIDPQLDNSNKLHIQAGDVLGAIKAASGK